MAERVEPDVTESSGLLCPGCNYDLRGLGSDTVSCPECGRRSSIAELRWRRLQSQRVLFFRKLDLLAYWFVVSAMLGLVLFVFTHNEWLPWWSSRTWLVIYAAAVLLGLACTIRYLLRCYGSANVLLLAVVSTIGTLCLIAGGLTLGLATLGLFAYLVDALTHEHEMPFSWRAITLLITFAAVAVSLMVVHALTQAWLKRHFNKATTQPPSEHA